MDRPRITGRMLRRDGGGGWIPDERILKGPEAFEPTIDCSAIAEQLQSPLFSKVPAEVRTRIFGFACTSSDEVDLPYAPNRVYHRPGYKFSQKAEFSLLQTCKRIYAEARLLPVSATEHTFWILGGPFQQRRTRGHAVGYFNKWQESLNDAQQGAVNFVHLFAQQHYLENMGIRIGAPLLDFRAKILTLTFRHSDWWSWESPPASADKLGICPWLPSRVSHQAMLSEPLKPTIEEMRALMFKGTWGWQIGQVKGLEVFRIEFETDIAKKSQLEVVLGRAKHWIFPLHNTNAFLECDGILRESQWVGQRHLQGDSLRAALKHVSLDPTTATEPTVPMRTYYVVEMTWRRRTLTKG